MRWGVVVFGVVLAGGIPAAGAQAEAGGESASESETGAASGAASESVPASVPVPVSESVSVSVSAPVSVPVSVLVAPVQGGSGIRAAYTDRVSGALSEALVARGYAVVIDEALGEGLVSCGTLGCIEQTLVGAGAAFGLVPAMWIRAGDRRELTLTLVGKSGRNLNAGNVIDGDLSQTAAALVDELLARRSELEPGAPDVLATDRIAIAVDDGVRVDESSSSPPAPADEPKQASARPNAWKAGPIVLWVGGASIFVAIGAAAGVKDENQQLNKGAVAAWSVIGAAALAGGTAWWVVGERRRRQGERSEATPDTAIRLTPGGFDLRLRF